MSVTTPDAIVAADTTRADPHRPSRSAMSTILVRGNLTWLGPLWASVLVLLPIALLVAAAADRNLTESLWSGAGIGWQRWILFTAGIVVARTFLREFVTRGVTRRRFADSAAVAMAVLAAIGAVVGIAGYLIEWAIFDWQDWRFELASGDPFGAGRLPRLTVEYAMLGAVYSACGWLVGSAFGRVRWVNATLLIPLCLVPAAIVELVVSRDTGNVRIDALPDPLTDPSVLLTLVIGLPAVAAAAFVAMRVTRALPLR